MTAKIYRQGDILFREIERLPDRLKGTKPTKNGVVALGEVTGHKHQVAHGDLWGDEIGGMVVEADSDTSIVHEEHAEIELPPGFYEVVRQREYVPPTPSTTSTFSLVRD